MKLNKFKILPLLFLLVTSNVFAALSAVVTPSPTTVLINQMVTASVAIQNTSASALNLTSLNITSNFNGVAGGKVPAAYGVLNLGPNSPFISIPANSTVTVPVQAIFFSPSTGVTGTGSGKFYIGANFTTSDGSVTSAATAGRVTVNPISLPASQL